MADDPAISATHSLLRKAFLPSKALSIFTEKLHRKPLFLHATPTNSRDLRRNERLQKRELQKRSTCKLKPLTAREKRTLKIHEIPLEAEKYALYEPLHGLWVKYMQEILQINPESGGGGGVGQTQIGLKLASADYHGAAFEVVRSRCPSRVGIEGICVKETRGMFYLITKGNKIKEVPKEHTIFRFELPVEILVPKSGTTLDSGSRASGPTNDPTSNPRSMVFELHGSQFMHRAGERVGRKFKQKPGIDL